MPASLCAKPFGPFGRVVESCAPGRTAARGRRSGGCSLPWMRYRGTGAGVRHRREKRSERWR